MTADQQPGLPGRCFRAGPMPYSASVPWGSWNSAWRFLWNARNWRLVCGRSSAA